MHIKTILLDMDDVLVDCTAACLKHMGLSDYNVIRDYPLDVGRDILEVYRRETGLSLPVQIFWEHFKREFWATIPPMRTYKELVRLCVDTVGETNVALCTSPTKCGDCLAGKLDWIEKNLPDTMQRQYIMTPRKHFCAAPGTLLIDDCPNNVSAFIEAGGLAIAFPRPWNENFIDMADPVPFIRKRLDMLERYASL